MTLRFRTLGCLGAAVLLAACASAGVDTKELGEGKSDFEQSSQGGNYHFQYVSDGSDGYRTVLWRQGETLSDDRKDEKLVAGVVRSVFLEKFCKDLKQPASLAEGSPSPVGQEGKWTASLRCAPPPPPPPKPVIAKKKPKAKSVPKPDAVSEASPKSEPKSEPETTPEDKPKPASKPAAKRSTSSDGPVECVANKDGGFDCKPKR